jgi:hypothetical protein
MKRIKLKAATLAAFWVAMVVGSYAAYGICCVYVAGNSDVCRRATTDTVDETIYSGGWTCVIDPISTDDDWVGDSYTLDYGGLCYIDTTYCSVAYICHNGLQSGVPMRFLYGNPAGNIAFNWLDCMDSACPSLGVSCPH